LHTSLLKLGEAPQKFVLHELKASYANQKKIKVKTPKQLCTRVINASQALIFKQSLFITKKQHLIHAGSGFKPIIKI